jgi:hypothetical protein
MRKWALGPKGGHRSPRILEGGFFILLWLLRNRNKKSFSLVNRLKVTKNTKALDETRANKAANGKP